MSTKNIMGQWVTGSDPRPTDPFPSLRLSVRPSVRPGVAHPSAYEEGLSLCRRYDPSCASLPDTESRSSSAYTGGIQRRGIAYRSHKAEDDTVDRMRTIATAALVKMK